MIISVLAAVSFDRLVKVESSMLDRLPAIKTWRNNLFENKAVVIASNYDNHLILNDDFVREENHHKLVQLDSNDLMSLSKVIKNIQEQKVDEVILVPNNSQEYASIREEIQQLYLVHLASEQDNQIELAEFSAKDWQVISHQYIDGLENDENSCYFEVLSKL